MPYNEDMINVKRKIFLYLPDEESAKFQIVLNRALQRDGRTTVSEVIRELMGFPPREGLRPVTTKADRDYLAGLSDELPVIDSEDGPLEASAEIDISDKVHIAPAKRKKVRHNP